ncbi:hypothetical protein Tcan_06809 [Toxocara canis]|uniref:Uncharacterized protein n=1 Tax=Toxocara canis TaxID=6265 RepID=A0A0B2W469_TOXCA|nr:hypothetical protein Tcan_06809 [Toxocara canis]
MSASNSKSPQTTQPTGEPISDSSEAETNDDQRHQQIVGLEEEKGIFGLPEVVVPPTFDSDEDESIKGASPLRSFRASETNNAVDIAQSSSVSDNNNKMTESTVLLGKTSDLEDLVPVSNLTYSAIDFEGKSASNGRTSRMGNVSERAENIEQHENSLRDRQESDNINQPMQTHSHPISNISDDNFEDDRIIGHRGFDYPTGPPPAYSSGEHTPEENPLIGEDDEDVSATIQPRFQVPTSYSPCLILHAQMPYRDKLLC